MKKREQKPLTSLEKMKKQSHTYNDLSPHKCTSTVVQKIDAPLPLVWSVVRRFDKPQAYKQFIRSCTVAAGDGGPGSVRELSLVSGLPAEESVERLDRLDDELHVMVFSIIGGDHKLKNYRSTMTLHEEGSRDRNQTVVMESYVVDVPQDSNASDTCFFADFIIRTNLKSLALLAEKMAANNFAR